MVDKNLLRADDAIASRARPHRVVIVLEHPDLEALVERSDFLKSIAPHRHAKHRRHADFGHLARVLARTAAREVEELAPRPVIGRNLRLVADAIRYWTGETDLRID